jgi:molybdopterin-guanine dinucleotide biosynthesis protein A
VPALALPRPVRATITGLVLAGGRGARLGGIDKGLALFDGRMLAVHVIDRLRPQVGSLLISANRNADRYAQWAPVVVDDDPAAYAGPLSGIRAAMAAAATDWLAVVPCDLPHVPRDVVERLAAAVGDAPAAFAAPAGHGHSLVCLLHRALRPQLDAAIAAGEARVGRWFASVGAQPVAFADAAAFANLNDADAFAAAAGHPRP